MDTHKEEQESQENKTVKKKRKRTVISKFDLEKLENLFKEDKWPSRRKKEFLAKATCKSDEFINTWFQNRRAKLRRMLRENSENDRKKEETCLAKDLLRFHDVDFNTFNEKSKEIKADPPDLDKEQAEHRNPYSKKRQKFQEEILQPIDESKVKTISKGVPWRLIFQRLVEMTAASEGVMMRSHSTFTTAVRDAALGIKLKDSKVVYNRDYGLDFIDHCQTRSMKGQ